MGKALYRKYRSKSLNEIIGQEHITTTLANALKSGKIAHAYLLTGPKGVGKTSIARILAHEVNGIPYSEDSNLDIIEIDAASNNGVEDVRDLRDKIPAAPVSATYKVFIIDEVHMLSKAAFNALLKTLEEPPAHVIFILATTEAYKLPETIVSRTQRFTFRPVSTEEVVEHLKYIAGKEKIQINDDALTLIAEHGDGSFRDSISLLDQVSNSSDAITVADVERLLGLAPTTLIRLLVEAMLGHDTAKCTQELDKLYNQGYEPAMIAIQISQILRGGIIDNTFDRNTLDILKDLIDVPASRKPKALLEITILKYAYAGEATTPIQQRTTHDSTPAEPKDPTMQKQTPPKPEPKPLATDTVAPEPAQSQEVLVERDDGQKEAAQQMSADEAALWQTVLESIRKSHNTLYGIARMAKPQISDDTLTLEFKFAFHQKRFTEPNNRAVISAIVEEIRKKPTKIVCVVVEKNTQNGPSNDSVKTISNIFGSAELLES